MIKISRNFFFFAMVLLLIVGAKLEAAETIPSRETAGAESTRFQEAREIEAQNQVLQEQPSKEPVIESESESPKTGAGTIFELKKIRVTGSKNIAAADLEALGTDLINRKVELKDLQELISKMKQFCREKGFIAVYIYLPPQEIQSGTVEIRVMEGETGETRIQGNHWFSEKTIRRVLRLSPGTIVQYDDLKKTLSRLNKNRDIKARAVLKPGAELKTTDIDIQVKDHFPVHLTTDVNNLGTENTGRTRWGVGLVHNNFLGFMDQLSGRFQIGSGAWAVGSDYSIPVSPWDTRLGFGYSHTSVEVGGPFKSLDVKGRASTYSPYLYQPLWDSRSFGADLNLGFDFKSIQNTVLGQKSGKDELRILNTGLNFEEADTYGKTFLPVSLHFGFSDFLGASAKVDPAASRSGTGGQFFIYRSSLTRYQHLPADLTLALRASWQVSPNKLPASEQFSLGGAFSVRGYPEGDYQADYGGLLASEIYVPSYFFPEEWKLPYSSMPLRKQIQGVAFFDFGAGALHDPREGDIKDRLLAGAGGGVRIHLFDRIFARLQWAGRTGGKSSDGTHSAFYYGISAELF